MWPLMASTTSSRVGLDLESSRALAAMIMPGVQKPHCTAKPSRNARCSGCRTPPAASPAVVSTFAPSQVSARVRQERRSSPSTSTAQEPQVPWWHPPLGEVSPNFSRRALSKVVPLSTNSALSSPLRVSWIGIFFAICSSLACGLVPKSAKQKPPEMHRQHLPPIPFAGDGIGRRVYGLRDRGNRRRYAILGERCADQSPLGFTRTDWPIGHAAERHARPRDRAVCVRLDMIGDGQDRHAFRLHA